MEQIREGNIVYYKVPTHEEFKKFIGDFYIKSKPLREYTFYTGQWGYTITTWVIKATSYNLSRYWIETYKRSKLVQISLGKKHGLYKILTNKEGSFYSVRYGSKEIFYSKDFVEAMRFPAEKILYDICIKKLNNG